MKAALAEKLANDESEARRREEQVQIKDQYKEAINLWKNKNKVSGLHRIYRWDGPCIDICSPSNRAGQYPRDARLATDRPLGG
jgi:hypothetical protein